MTNSSKFVVRVVLELRARSETTGAKISSLITATWLTIKSLDDSSSPELQNIVELNIIPMEATVDPVSGEARSFTDRKGWGVTGAERIIE